MSWLFSSVDAPGLSRTRGVVWIFEKDGISGMRIEDEDGTDEDEKEVGEEDREADEEMENNCWKDEGTFEGGVNWANLESLIKGPFAKSLRYELVGFLERFSIEGDEMAQNYLKAEPTIINHLCASKYTFTKFFRWFGVRF